MADATHTMADSEPESALQFPSEQEIVDWVRATSGVAAGAGPSDKHIVRAVQAAAKTFAFWYSRVMKEAVGKYEKLIIARINPYIRRMQLEGQDPASTAKTLIADYESRNFVTAGGWVLEALAVNIGPRSKKSLIEGVDLEREESPQAKCEARRKTPQANQDRPRRGDRQLRSDDRLHDAHAHGGCDSAPVVGCFLE